MGFWDILLKNGYKKAISGAPTDQLYEDYAAEKLQWMTNGFNKGTGKKTFKMHCLEEEIYKRIACSEKTNTGEKYYNDTTNCTINLDYGEILYHIENPDAYNEYNNITDARAWGEPLYNEWSEAYSNTLDDYFSFFENNNILRTSPFKLYCGNYYTTINQYLKEGRSSKCVTLIPTTITVAHSLLFAMCQAPRINENIVLYRGVTQTVVESIMENNRNQCSGYCESSFLSTSLLKIKAKEHGRFLLKLYVRNNTVGVYVNSLSDTKRDEEEVLLPFNAYLRLVDDPFYDEEIEMLVFPCKVDY